MAKKDRKKKVTAQPSATAGGPLAGLPPLTGPWYWVVVTILLLVLLGVTYPGPMFQGQVFLSADTSNSDAFALVGDAERAAGHYPLWSPYLFAGMPSFGSLAYVPFLYPPSILFNFAQDHLAFPPLTWMLAHLLFGGLGMAWLLGRWRLPLAAVMLGVAAWILFPKVVAWGVHGHGSKLGAAMYLPWIVGWTLRVLDGAGWRAVGMTGLLMGLQILRGHPQITYYTLLAVGWLSAWNAVWPLEEAGRRVAAAVRWRRVAMVLGGLALGFMIGSIMLLPVHDYTGISIRGQDTAGGGGVGLDYATGWSLAPRETGTFVLPVAAGFGKATYLGLMPFNDYPNYFGLLLLVLAAVAWWQAPRSLVIALGVMSLLAVFVAFGNFGFGLYELLYRVLPFFNKFRIPSMIMVLMAFAVAVLAARGLAALQEGVKPFGRPAVLPAVLAGLGLILLLGGATGLFRDGYLSSLQEMAAAGGRQAPEVLLREAWILHKGSLVRIGLILLTAGAAVFAAGRNPRLAGVTLGWIMVALVGLDLGGVDKLIASPETGLKTVARDASGRGVLTDSGKLLHKPAAVRRITTGPGAGDLAVAVGHDRVWPLGAHSGRNTWMPDRIRSLGGYSPLKMATYEQIRKRIFADPPAGRLVNWLGGTVVAIDRPLAPGDFPVLTSFGVEVDPDPLPSDGPALYRNLAALPRARLLTRWQPVSALPEKDDLPSFLDGVQAGEIDVRDQVWLNETPVPEPRAAAQALPAPVFTVDGTDEVVLTVDSPVPALLLLADMMAPGWKVEVDGEAKPLLTADLVLRAVALEAGPHTVRFHYSAQAVGRGLTLSALGVMLVLILLLLPLAARLRPKTPEGISAHE